MTQGDGSSRQISDDGEWEWDGSQWQPRSPQGQMPPPPPQQRYPASSYNPTPQPKEKHTLRNVLLIIVLLLVLFVGGCIALIGGAVNEVDKAITEAEKSSDTGGQSADDGSSFKNGVLTTPDMKVEITRHKVIPVGQTGNEYGSKPVIAFWYKMTNRSGKALNPTDIVVLMTAYQDNNPNAENELEVGMHPDDSLVDAQMENIKKGGTVEGAVAFELDDTKTPVELVASDDLGFSEIGKMTYQLK